MPNDSSLLPAEGSLVYRASNGEPVTDSLIVAAHTGNDHRSVIRMVRENLGDLNDVGIVRFEIRKSLDLQGQPVAGRPTEAAVLDEPAATLLCTYLRNTPKVKQIKKALVRDFYRMRQALTERVAPASPAELLLAQAQVLVDQEQRLNTIESQQQQLAQRVDAIMPEQRDELFYSGRGWARLRNVEAAATYLRKVGAKAGVIGRAAGIEPDRVPDTRWGEVNGWPLWVWDAAYDQVENPRAAS